MAAQLHLSGVASARGETYCILYMFLMKITTNMYADNYIVTHTTDWFVWFSLYCKNVFALCTALHCFRCTVFNFVSRLWVLTIFWRRRSYVVRGQRIHIRYMGLVVVVCIILYFVFVSFCILKGAKPWWSGINANRHAHVGLSHHRPLHYSVWLGRIALCF